MLLHAAGGLARALGRTIAAHPAGFAGAAAFVAVGAAVSANALGGQSMHHPQPMLITRVIDAMPTASAGTGAGTSVVTNQPWRPTNDPRIMTVPLVREVQELLAKAGFYEAEIDGRPGQATDRAIRTFQAERGLRVDGMATPLLLTQVRQLAGEAPRVASLEAGQQYAGLDDLMSDLSGDNADIPILDEEPADPGLVRAIQERLAQAKVAELTADGIAGSRTRDAIRSFQALEGLTVTGQPTPGLLERLEAVAGGR